MKYIHMLLRGTHVIDFSAANLQLWMRMKLHMLSQKKRMQFVDGVIWPELTTEMSPITI